MELSVAPLVELRQRLATFFADLVSEAMSTRDASSPFCCGLTGGSAALIYLGALREAHVDWSHVTLYWGDERAVSPLSADSNFSVAESLLLTPLGERAPQAVRMPADAVDLKAAARQYAKLLPAALDLLILGVGDDGHVCSLFPGHDALRAVDATVLVIENAPKPPVRRLTLSFPYIVRSRHVWIIAIGERKRPLLHRILARDPAVSPVERVIAQGQNVTLFTDQVIRQGSARVSAAR